MTQSPEQILAEALAALTSSPGANVVIVLDLPTEVSIYSSLDTLATGRLLAAAGLDALEQAQQLLQAQPEVH